MKLRYSPASPFARKVRIAAAVLGLADRIELVAADTNNPEDSLRAREPARQDPDADPRGRDHALRQPRHRAISRRARRRRQAAAGGRAGALQGADATSMLADGITDAAILLVYEGRFREPAERSAKWRVYQTDKIAASACALGKPRRRRQASSTSSRSRSPARSATSICDSKERWRTDLSAPRRVARRIRSRCAGLRGDAVQGVKSGYHGIAKSSRGVVYGKRGEARVFRGSGGMKMRIVRQAIGSSDRERGAVWGCGGTCSRPSKRCVTAAAPRSRTAGLDVHGISLRLAADHEHEG